MSAIGIDGDALWWYPFKQITHVRRKLVNPRQGRWHLQHEVALAGTVDMYQSVERMDANLNPSFRVGRYMYVMVCDFTSTPAHLLPPSPRGFQRALYLISTLGLCKRPWMMLVQQLGDPSNVHPHTSKWRPSQITNSGPKRKHKSPTPKASKDGRKTNKSGTKSSHDPAHPGKVADVQATDLPAPIPGFTTLATPNAQILVPPSSGIILATEIPSPTIDYGITSTVWVYTTYAPVSSLPTSSKATKATSNHLPIFIFVLIAIGSTCVLVCAFVFARFCLLRKLKRARPPTPSAPILQDSPLFGGKDRFARWSDASFGNLASMASAKAGLGLGKNNGWKPLNDGNIVNEKPVVVVPRFPQPAVSPASVYPQTPATPAERIAVALEQTPPSISVMPPPNLPPTSNAKRSKDERRRSRHSIASSMYGGVEMHSPIPSLPYLSPCAVASPGKSTGNVPSRPSRERIQAPYNRKSDNTGSRQLPKAQTAQRLGKDEPLIQYSIPTVKSMERKERDTKALTTALGLSSPTTAQLSQTQQPVSCFSPASVYPDDSISRRETRASYITDTPSGRMHAAIGSLMLQEIPFPSAATLTNMPPLPPPPLDITKKQPQKPAAHLPVSHTQASTRIDARPPRVPSPPPLPSLAQMAMQGSNPDYHSPTYSIYGLYSDRKSTTTTGLGA